MACLKWSECVMKLKVCLLGLLLLPLLQGCVTAAVATGATAATAVATDPRSTDSMYDDQVISHEVETKIQDTKGMKDHSNVTATAYAGNVLLTGQVTTAALKAEMEQIAASVPKVKKVYNQLSVGPLTGAKTYSEDTWITTKVRAELLASQGFDSSDIKVVTQSNIVYLLGLGTQAQRDLAIQKIQAVSGVKEVVDLFQVKPASVEPSAK